MFKHPIIKSLFWSLTVLAGPLMGIALADPKPTISVAGFNANGAFIARYGVSETGGGLASILTTALQNTGRFTVVERAQVQASVVERELNGAGLTNNSSSNTPVYLAGVQMLVFGSVTDISEERNSHRVSLGFSGLLKNVPFLGAISPQMSIGMLTMDFRVVNAETAQVLMAFSVSEEIRQVGVGLSVGYKSLAVETAHFLNTAIGDAARRGIERAAKGIATARNLVSWRGHVVGSDGKFVYINGGATSGLQPGDIFMIERPMFTLTDPASGKVLGVRSQEIGVLTVQRVEAQYAYGTYSSLEKTMASRGDVAVVIRKPSR